MHDDDAIIDVLGGLDPAGDAPVPGSARYDSILENAMTLIDEPTASATHSPDATVTSISSAPHRSGRRRMMWLGAAAAVLAVTASGALVLRPDSVPSAEAAVREAADQLSEVTSLRATLITDPSDAPEGQYQVAQAEISPDGFQVRVDLMDGETTLESSTVVVVDGTIYEVDADGAVLSSEPADDGDYLAPFAQASTKVVEAALTGEVTGDVDEPRNTMEPSGETVRHISLTMNDASRAAISALTPQELAWFELEYADDLDSIEVWVSDGLIEQIRVTGDLGQTDIYYSDFNDDITISAPES